ncbi:class I SAM-dependent methyltransferase [Mycobacterium sp. MYCO198283]|uniref:class I SAM-dependent methyltransferase n=1 Tax=Mycobacterium sp. MYCO198283 TaxID=2883505 RepID=UPI001E2A064B|nr:class I SAM-dependent methyltransferase [Mycobacterium sp. MYCO198283]MCG5432354.1 class I SAM-dependent methyltransferase [Mycobacterium sp. MYCO198283]
MLGNLYDRALDGERCWVRRDDGHRRLLPVRDWLGGRNSDEAFDAALVDMCEGPTLDLACGPGRLVARLIARGVPALGVDQSATAVRLAHRSGAPALHRDLFSPLPGTGRWQTVLLADGNVGIGGEPRRILARAAELLGSGGRCLAEFESGVVGIQAGWVRLESRRTVGPWFRWASVGVDCAAALAEEVGMTLVGLHPVGRRVVASLAVG